MCNNVNTEQAPLLGQSSTMNDRYQLNIRNLFERGCLIQPNSEIVTLLKDGRTDRIKYFDVKQRATKIALLLKNQYNILNGDIIGTFMWSNIRHMLLLYAIPCMGAILNPINLKLHPNELSYIIKHSQHKIIFIDEDLLDEFSKIPYNALQSVEYFIICGGNKHNDALLSTKSNIYKRLQNINYNKQKILDFNQFENDNIYIGLHPFIWPNLDERSGATLLYTSGTTGNPKGVLYSHRSLYIHLLNLSATDSFSLSGVDCCLPLIQIFHVLGTLMPLLGLFWGFKLLLSGNCSDYNKILNFCLNEHCTVISGVPTHIQSFRQTLRLNPNKYIGIKGILTRIGCGGSAPPSDLVSWFWDNYKIEIIHSWGMTETQGIAYISRRCCTRNDLLLNDEEKNNNTQVPGIPSPSIHGKLIKNFSDFYVNGPIVTSSYYGIKTPNKFDNNGWLNTGDIVSFTKKNQIIIHDRSKDMIKSGGEWISSQDIENCIYLKYNKLIDKVCVVGIQHEIWRERPIIIIQLFDHIKKTAIPKKQILIHLSQNYANYQLPDDILFWKKIPLTGTGKLSKKDVREILKNEKYKLPKIPLRKQLNLNSKL